MCKLIRDFVMVYYESMLFMLLPGMDDNKKNQTCGNCSNILRCGKAGKMSETKQNKKKSNFIVL